MRILAPIAALSICLAGTAVAHKASTPRSVDSAAPMPAQNAFATSPGDDQANGAEDRRGCLNGMRLLSHTAFDPASDMHASQCGQPLSTDTLITVHRWDRT